jgi:hypothetical protein
VACSAYFLVEQRVRRDRGLQSVGLELLDGLEPQVLVQRVPGQVELEHVLDAGVVGHVVQPGRLQPPLGLSGGVGPEVGQQVAAGHDEPAVPRVTVAVGEQRAAAGHDGLLRVHAAEHGPDHGISSGGFGGGSGRGSLEQPGDHDGHHLDVPDFLGGHVHDQVLVLAGHPAVPPLEQVSHVTVISPNAPPRSSWRLCA